MSDAKPLLVETGRGFSLYWRERWLYSRYDPLRNPLAAVRGCTLREQTLYLIPSPCLCHGIEELLSLLPASSAVLCVETMEELMAVAIVQSVDLRSRFPKLKLIRTDIPAKVVQYARSLGSFHRIVTLRLSQGWSLDTDLYAAIERVLNEDMATQFRNRITLARMGRLWVKNLISNVAGIPWDAVLRFPETIDKPIIVCGAGPSLDSAITFLRSVARDCHIMACDTACGALAQAGIIVDSVVCLEGQIHNIPDFLPLNRKKTVLFADISAHPASFRAVEGKKVLVSSQWLPSSLPADKDTLSDQTLLGRLANSGMPVRPVPPLGSVGVLALHLAGQLASRDIFVTGLDFSFPPGRTHCSGSPVAIGEYRKQTRLYRNGIRWAVSHREGVYKLEPGMGGPVLCDPALAMYAGLARNEIITLVKGKPQLRFHDLRQGQGFSLPLEAVSYETAAKIVASSAADRAKTAGRQRVSAEPKRNSDNDYRKMARDFLQAEFASIGRLRQELKNGKDRECLRAQLKRLEYLFAHFPDSERVLSLEQDALNRVAAEVAYWQHRFEIALEINAG